MPPLQVEGGCSLHLNQLELLAVCRSLRHFLPSLRGLDGHHYSGGLHQQARGSEVPLLRCGIPGLAEVWPALREPLCILGEHSVSTVLPPKTTRMCLWRWMHWHKGWVISTSVSLANKELLESAPPSPLCLPSNSSSLPNLSQGAGGAVIDSNSSLLASKTPGAVAPASTQGPAVSSGGRGLPPCGLGP